MRIKAFALVLLLTSLLGCGPSHKEIEEIAVVSRRWQEQHAVTDLLWLGKHALRRGTTEVRVKELLGPPLDESPRDDGGKAWTYVKFDPKTGQACWIIFINAKGKFEGLHTKSIM